MTTNNEDGDGPRESRGVKDVKTFLWEHAGGVLAAIVGGLAAAVVAIMVTTITNFNDRIGKLESEVVRVCEERVSKSQNEHKEDLANFKVEINYWAERDLPRDLCTALPEAKFDQGSKVCKGPWGDLAITRVFRDATD